MSDFDPRRIRMPSVDASRTIQKSLQNHQRLNEELAADARESYERKERLRTEEVERNEFLLELTASQVQNTSTLAALMVEQHVENRRLALLTWLVSVAVLVQVALLLFEPTAWWTRLIAVAGCIALALGLYGIGRVRTSREPAT